MKKKKDLYRKYRPRHFEDVVGQDAIVASLNKMISKDELPHTLMFAGPTGTGKTTVARIICNLLECGDMDLVEMNAANTRGIDDVRRIEERMSLAPLAGKVRIWIIDEAHKLTSDAQNSLLKPTEDTPDHVYFILCTSEPDKIISALRGRCTRFDFGKISDEALFNLLKDVSSQELAEQEGSVKDKVLQKIVECSNGSARNALVLLGKVIDAPSTNAQLELISNQDAEHDAYEICQLLFKPKSKWSEMAALLRELLKTDKDDQAEKIRRMILGYAKGILLKGKESGRAYLAIQELRDNFFDSGTAGLVGSLFAIYNCND